MSARERQQRAVIPWLSAALNLALKAWNGAFFGLLRQTPLAFGGAWRDNGCRVGLAPYT